MNAVLDPSFTPGTWILGKWNRKKYQIIRLLGEGSNGRVYLVKCGITYFAMKMGFTVIDHQSEVNVLKALSLSSKKDSYLVDVDDFQCAKTDYPFYIMRYVKGVSIVKYLHLHGEDWIYMIGKNILKKLAHLHAQGWIFGDLKMDNILVSGYGGVDLIDYGGVTLKGRSVKQFTEIYDRGYWGMGTRNANEGYDLFSFAILCIQLIDLEPKQSLSCLPPQRNIEHLMEIIQSSPQAEQITPFLYPILQGKWSTSAQAYTEWSKQMLQIKGVNADKALPISWLKGAFVVAAAGFASTLYLVLQ